VKPFAKWLKSLGLVSIVGSLVMVGVGSGQAATDDADSIAAAESTMQWHSPEAPDGLRTEPAPTLDGPNVAHYRRPAGSDGGELRIIQGKKDGDGVCHFTSVMLLSPSTGNVQEDELAFDPDTCRSLVVRWVAPRSLANGEVPVGYGTLSAGDSDAGPRGPVAADGAGTASLLFQSSARTKSLF